MPEKDSCTFLTSILFLGNRQFHPAYEMPFHITAFHTLEQDHFPFFILNRTRIFMFIIHAACPGLCVTLWADIRLVLLHVFHYGLLPAVGADSGRLFSPSERLISKQMFLTLFSRPSEKSGWDLRHQCLKLLNPVSSDLVFAFRQFLLTIVFF